jgi:hypothetical protein
MSRLFLDNPVGEKASNLMYYKSKWATEAYPQNNGRGTPSVKDINFIEMTHYGLIDHENNSIIPNPDYIVEINNGRLLDFVADSYALLRLNYTTALRKGQITNEGSLFGGMDIVQSYTNPRKKYGEYLDGILQFFNKTHIPRIIGKLSIASYKDYVNHFFNFLLNNSDDVPITMTRWNTSFASNILDTGLAFMYADMDYENDFLKAQQIIDTPCFPFIRNLTLNMSFSIVHQHPNIFLYDVSSPAGSSIRNSYGLLTLNEFFNLRFIKTYTIDNNILYNTINNNYNKYVFRNSSTKKVYTKCGKTVTEEINLSTVPNFTRPFTDLEELNLYCLIRNKEEGEPFSPQKVENIFKKAKYFLKKVDKPSAMSYINSMFRDQVWNKNNGYHDLRQKYFGQTQTEAQRQQTGGGPSSGGSSY